MLFETPKFNSRNSQTVNWLQFSYLLTNAYCTDCGSSPSSHGEWCRVERVRQRV